MALNGSNGSNGTCVVAEARPETHSSDPVELWRHPDPEATQMHGFKEFVNAKYGLQLHHYEDLHKWSVENLGDFWSEVWDFVGIRGEKGQGEVCESFHYVT